MSLDLKDKKGIGFKYAVSGIFKVWKSERNFRIDIVIALLVILFGILLGLAKWEWITILICIGIVLALEMINSVVESMVDYLFKEYHPVAERVKDISAGSVLTFAIIATIIGVFIFIPKVLTFIF